ncbi:hypothetical protein HYC85_015028 [Camellia sinensis]|uniref:Secreted protein n=1 Tax=Camellia sinensis TaxID=4442 RepID=A0A7J7HA09_CAMSI|nr:hypothetical protein HYC85_015028 [Camellia sinensis]
MPLYIMVIQACFFFFFFFFLKVQEDDDPSWLQEDDDPSLLHASSLCANPTLPPYIEPNIYRLKFIPT